MKHSCSKWFLVFVVTMAVSLVCGTKAIAGVVVEDYNAKLHKATGVITKIQGKMLTLRTDKGEIIKIGVRGETQEDKNSLRRFKIGDRLIIEDGKVMKTSTPRPVSQPSQRGTLPVPLPRPAR